MRSRLPFGVQRERCIRKYFLGRGWSGFLILIAAVFVGKFDLGCVQGLLRKVKGLGVIVEGSEGL